MVTFRADAEKRRERKGLFIKFAKFAVFAIFPPKWLAGSSRVTAELTFCGGGSEGARR